MVKGVCVMELDVVSWMGELCRKLSERFGKRLLFAGLQGSRQRGEAREDSDIDVVVVLDRVEAEDLAAYRSLLRDMPQGGLACGFICGLRELRGWPGYDLVALSRDTKGYYGDLLALLPPLGREDELTCVQVGAANLYHAACHTLLFGELEPQELRGLYKSAFFLLRMDHALRTGEYVPTRKELLEKLRGARRQVLLDEAGTGGALQRAEYEERLGRLIGLCGEILQKGPETCR
ncbi:MAG: nucleotidyltransferase domain-containing protein [Clostridiales bacterium]|uniref:nucleotidyltransferase domain-containing protein n=1 Tax=Provencibacterium massiliense TaxID=1841868 RepID=UPI0009A79509|nr:nucleotidyltransferase domain-containing protein [Provencibacterium massiliense]PWM40715.1 MAG: nucleotidyltransferase domain-containing protein [Clostridiales bacterium]RGB67293.1 nucleotidyltransferase domain-containing protein [Harryflintia acetispora]